MEKNQIQTILGFTFAGGLLGCIWLLLNIFLEAYGFGDCYCVQASLIFADRAKQLGIDAAELYKLGSQLVVQKALFQYAWPCLGPTTIGGAVIGWVITMCSTSAEQDNMEAPPAGAYLALAADKEAATDCQDHGDFIKTKLPIQENT